MLGLILAQKLWIQLASLQRILLKRLKPGDCVSGKWSSTESHPQWSLDTILNWHRDTYAEIKSKHRNWGWRGGVGTYTQQWPFLELPLPNTLHTQSAALLSMLSRDNMENICSWKSIQKSGSVSDSKTPPWSPGALPKLGELKNTWEVSFMGHPPHQSTTEKVTWLKGPDLTTTSHRASLYFQGTLLTAWGSAPPTASL